MLLHIIFLFLLFFLAGVDCHDDPDLGYRCGPCPPGMTGDGTDCRPYRPIPSCGPDTCYPGVRCVDTPDGPRCGPCPPGLVGDGTRSGCIPTSCNDQPCYHGVRCTDTIYGAICDACPPPLVGDGTRDGCKMPGCEDQPCYPGVQCQVLNNFKGSVIKSEAGAQLNCS